MNIAQQLNQIGVGCKNDYDKFSTDIKIYNMKEIADQLELLALVWI